MLPMIGFIKLDRNEPMSRRTLLNATVGAPHKESALELVSGLLKFQSGFKSARSRGNAVLPPKLATMLKLRSATALSFAVISCPKLGPAPISVNVNRLTLEFGSLRFTA